MTHTATEILINFCNSSLEKVILQDSLLFWRYVGSYTSVSCYLGFGHCLCRLTLGRHWLFKLVPQQKAKVLNALIIIGTVEFIAKSDYSKTTTIEKRML